MFSVAECLYDAVQGPIVADLAPDGLVGRYMALNAFSWQLGFITGPPVAAAGNGPVAAGSTPADGPSLRRLPAGGRARQRRLSEPAISGMCRPSY